MDHDLFVFLVGRGMPDTATPDQRLTWLRNEYRERDALAAELHKLRVAYTETAEENARLREEVEALKLANKELQNMRGVGQTLLPKTKSTAMDCAKPHTRLE